MRIIFVYAGDPHNDRLDSPHTITKNLYHYLSQRADVVYYDWTSGGPIELRADDIFLGHPNYTKYTVTQWVFQEGGKIRAKCLIHPLHTNRIEDNWPFDDLARAADAIFSITGPYWYDNLEQTPFAHWKPKIVRLDMAVDANRFPFVREQFHPPGQRRLLYIGSTYPHKNLGYLTDIMQRMPQAQLTWYGGSSDHPLARLPNVRTVGWTVLDPGVARQIVQECDIFINTSSSDACPTTLLETAAWGLIPMCTVESGYYADERCDNMFDAIHLDNIQQSISNVEKLLYTSSDVLLERARRTREYIATKYTWERFCSRIWERLSELM